MFNFENRIGSLAVLGRILRAYAEGATAKPHDETAGKYIPLLRKEATEAELENPWFIQPFISYALKSTGESLQQENLEAWLRPYGLFAGHSGKPKNIGVVMAGNIPLVGFHDMLAVLVTGNKFQGKLSAKDARLPVAIAKILTEIEPGWKPHIEFTEGALLNPDAIIATGSDNTSRYFQYYFGKHPHIIRKNRNSPALLQGDETDTDLDALADDVFLYFGLGCRSVSKLLVPEGYDFKPLVKSFEKYGWLINHKKYANNYSYHRAIYQMNREPHLDTGFLLLKQDNGLSSPVAVLFYQYYRTIDEAGTIAVPNIEEIQCLVGNRPGLTAFGASQNPELWDYADGIDTIRFLNSL